MSTLARRGHNLVFSHVELPASPSYTPRPTSLPKVGERLDESSRFPRQHIIAKRHTFDNGEVQYELELRHSFDNRKRKYELEPSYSDRSSLLVPLEAILNFVSPQHLHEFENDIYRQEFVQEQMIEAERPAIKARRLYAQKLLKLEAASVTAKLAMVSYECLKKNYAQTTISPSFFQRKSRSNAAIQSPSPSGSVGADKENGTRLSKYSEPRPSSEVQSGSLQSTTKQDKVLAKVAAGTKAILPDLLKTAQWARPYGILCTSSDVKVLDQKFSAGFKLPQDDPFGCGGHSGTRIKVVSQDSFDAAIDLNSSTSTRDRKPVAVLNMANAVYGGGGWLKGALAQEEALCYRSSLSFTLKKKYYPLPDISGIYSPRVIVFRKSIRMGHTLLDFSNLKELPVLSVISVAAMRDPSVTQTTPPKYTNEDRDMTKSKMAMVLRIAAWKGHRRLVLGAFGCGAFNNPPDEVVECWKEVFAEKEFQGGWWESVIFAVLGGEEAGSNFEIFRNGLQDLLV
ncbi:MAG: hypothetical protein M1837_005601 [Sclerophora amabilis]|nr:MAG: hypothetical protein M1837_005601 [Sclerophora amabilis]